jgi:cellulose synthase operon protein C
MRLLTLLCMPAPRISVGIAALCTALLLCAGCDALRSNEARIEQAREALAVGDYRGASLNLKAVLDSEPENAEARLALAEASLAMGDAAAADKDLRRALAAGLPPERSAPLQGRIMLALGQAADLLKLLNDGALPVKEPDWSVLKGDALASLGDMPAAEALYRSAQTAHPQHVRATVGLALAIAAQGRKDDALEMLAQLTQAQPDAGEAWLLRGGILASSARYPDAEEAFKRAAADRSRGLGLPQQLAALTGLAEAQLVRGGVADAKSTLERMRALASGAPPTRLITARIALMEQDYATVVAQLQPLVAGLPNLAPARFLLGAAFLAQGNLEQAETHLAHLVQISPDNVEARKLLAKARLRLQRYDAAMQVLSPAMQGETIDPELSSLLSAAKLQAGAQGEAIEVLEQSAQRNPDNVGLKLDLATAYIAGGRSAQAVELLRALPEVKGDTRREALLVTALAAARGPAEARGEVERLVAGSPQDINILSLAAAYSLSQRDFAGARGFIERALAIEPSNPRLLMTLAQTEVRAGSLDAAEAALRRLLAVPASRTAARFGLVEVAQLRGKAAEARKELERIRAEDPKAVAPRLLLARMMLSAKEAEPASKVLAEVVAISPRDARLHLQVARLLAEFSRYDEALRQLREAVEIAPEVTDAWLEMARVHLALDRPEPAREAAERAVALDHDSVEGNGLLALLDLREKRGEAALQRARALSTRKPQEPRAAVLEGDVRFSLGQFREAAQAYNRAFGLRPALHVAAKEATALRSAGMPSPEAPLARWVAERPDDDGARALLAEAYQVTGRRNLAIEQYERLAARPEVGFAALNNLAWLYYEAGDAKAEATARRAYDLASNNPAVADTYGWILTEKGNVKEGLPVLAKAAAQARTNPDIRFHHAVALARSGDVKTALGNLNELLASHARFSTRGEALQLRDRLAAGAGAGGAK